MTRLGLVLGGALEEQVDEVVDEGGGVAEKLVHLGAVGASSNSKVIGSSGELEKVEGIGQVSWIKPWSMYRMLSNHLPASPQQASSVQSEIGW